MDARRRTVCLLSGLTVAALLCAPGEGLSQTGTTAVFTKQAVPAPSAPPVAAQPPAAAATTKAAAAAELPAQVFADGADASKAAPADPKAAEEAQKKAAEEQKKAQRLQKLQQLTFDRRPSAILKAWALTDEAARKERDEKRKAATADQPATPGEVVEPGVVVEVAAPNVAVDANPSAAKPAADPFDDELWLFQRRVTRGEWPAVAKFLADLPEAEGKAAYKQLVAALPNSVPGDLGGGGGANARQAMIQQQQMMMQQQGPLAQFAEKTALTARDVVALAGLAPHGRDKEAVTGLGQLLQLAIARGDSVEDFVGLVRAGRAAAPPPKGGLDDREVAKVLLAAGHQAEMGPFLPEPAKAEADNDREALNLLSRLYLAEYAKDKKVAALEKAWKVTLAALAVGEVTPEQKDEALKRAVELAPKVQEDFGLKWLEESFTRRPERGMEIIAAIGAASSKGLLAKARDPEARAKALALQKSAVEALLKSPAGAAGPAAGPQVDWAKSLALLAGAWLAEAEFSEQHDTSTSLGPRMRRDVYGNFFYSNGMMDENGNMMMGMNNPNMPQAVPVAKVIEAMPGAAWVARLDDGLRPKYAAVAARLYLKVGEDEKAFPYVEALAPTHPELARQQAEEFLRVWTKNHDPNAERNLRNPYIYMFGFEQKAESIPLTRSKQERNLKELAAWVARLRKLPVRELDEKLIAHAFTACHSSAEVYRLETIEAVLGNFDALKPETLAELAQQMRGNLAGLWRAPAVQDQNKTKRKEKDIRAEVLRGYDVARGVVDRGLEKHPATWGLTVARAAIRHDENNYRQEIEPDEKFSKRRADALGVFAEAAKQYAAKVATLSEDDETTAPFESWFYAALGASDLAGISEKNQPDPKQFPLIRAAILGLPGEAAARHMGKFANALFTRMSALNPAVKFRYLKGGFEVVGDHEQAHEAKKVYDYYKDLVTEIKLEAAVDGSVEVGAGKPFGLFVNLKHTREIEREAGGFGKYLQNQNAGNGYYYNYGRPLENYRDKFQDVVKKAFEEHFEVMSVTFQDEKVNSRATPEYGWRYTPYAYILMKAKGPKTDKIPPLRLDLDFLDTSGYVIMPVESPAVPVDANPAKPASRPFTKLQVTQTLDERQAKDGKLILEVKATALGLVPPLEEVVALKEGDFKVAKTDDQGLSVSRFDPDAEGNAVVSERTWLIDLEAAPGLPERPKRYAFPAPKAEGAEVTYQRYVDADLAKVDPEVDLEGQYGTPSRAWVGWALAGLVALTAASVLIYYRRPAEAAPAGRFAAPDPLTPFSALGLLREIQLQDAVPEARRRELAAAIADLEAHYFAGADRPAPDLRAVVGHWIKLAG